MDNDQENAIRERAYALWEADGCVDGRDLDHWLRAEEEITNGASVPGDDKSPERAASSAKRRAQAGQ